MHCSHSILGFVAALAVGSWLPAQETKPVAPTPDATTKESPKKEVPTRPTNPQQVPKTDSGNSWFPVTELDLGTHFGHEEAVGVFQWKNPKATPIVWKNLTGSCTCTKAVIVIGPRRYELVSKPEKQLVRVTNQNGKETREVVQQLTIEPGEEGVVEVHMEMHGVSGPRQASLDIHTTDETLQQIKLKWHATGAQMFVISPAEVNLNKMVWNESREFTVSVTSPLNKDFNIKRMDDAGKSFQVTWNKTMNGDQATWTIQGKYGPLDGEAAGGGGVLKFYTDIQGETSFLVRVMAMVQGPLEVKPGGFLPLGMIRKGSELKKEVVFEPNDGVKLEATKLSFEKLTMGSEFVTATQRNDGNKLIIELAVSQGAPAGLLRGDLVVELNHPLVKEKRIMFNGFVR